LTFLNYNANIKLKNYFINDVEVNMAIKKNCFLLIILLILIISVSDSLAAEEKKVFSLGEIEIVSKKGTDKDIVSDKVLKEDLRTFERDTVEDALNLMPGVTLTKAGARNETMVLIRGFDLKHAPLFLDGVPVYVIYDGYPDLGRFTTFNLSKISVSKGFSSVLYGPNTMGGAINMVTSKPLSEFETEGGIGIASGDGRKAYANAGTNQGKWYAQAGYSYLDQDYFDLSDDFESTAEEDGGKRENSYRTDKKVNLKLGWTPTGRNEYALTYIKQDGEKGTPPYAGNNPDARPRFWKWPYWDKESIYFNSKTAAGDKTNIKTRLYYDTYKNSLHSFDDSTYTTMNKKYAFKSKYDDYTVGGNIELETGIFNSSELRTSFHYKKDVHTEKDEGKPELEFIDDIFSVGIEDELSLNKDITLVVGASYDYLSPDKAEEYDSDTGKMSSFEKESASAFNPQACIFYKISPTGTLHAAIAKKSRLPSLKDRYSYRMGYGLPNPGLDEETSINYEIGYQDYIFERLEIKTAAFYNDIDDYIMFVAVPDPEDNTKNVDQNQNIGEVAIFGAEAGIVLNITDQMKFGTSYTYTDWDNKNSGEKLTDIPKHKVFSYFKSDFRDIAGLMASYEFNSGRIQSADGKFETGSYSLVNLKADFKLYAKVRLETGVDNLFDTNYEIDEGYPEAGRSLYANITWEY